jgi:hypothetical protein
LNGGTNELDKSIENRIGKITPATDHLDEVQPITKKKKCGKRL